MEVHPDGQARWQAAAAALAPGSTASQAYQVLWPDDDRHKGPGWNPSREWHHFGVGRAGRDKVTQGEASLVGNFPVGRFLMSALTWVFLLLHVNLVRRQCCALTGFAWAKGANGGWCTCAAAPSRTGDGGERCNVPPGAIEGGRYTHTGYDRCCMHGSCTSEGPDRGRAVCLVVSNSSNERYGDDSGYDDEHDEFSEYGYADDDDEHDDFRRLTEQPARTPSCTCCAPSFRGRAGATTSSPWDDAKPDIEAFFSCFVIMWFFTFVNDLDLTIKCRHRSCDKHKRGSLISKLKLRWRRNGTQQNTAVGAEGFAALTRSACDAAPTIMMKNECAHSERRGKSTVHVATHNAERLCLGIQMADEASKPLVPARCGGGWEISYFSASGEPRVARSKTGLFELRVTYDLRWETTEDERAFATQFTQFAAEPDNRVDVLQMNWVEVQAPIDRCCLCELVEGAAPSCLNLPCCVLCSFLTLGWLYHAWEKSLGAVVELHLCKTLRSTGDPVSTSWAVPVSGRGTVQELDVLLRAAPEAGGTDEKLDDLVDKLKELAAMKDTGVLTDSEFLEAKAKLLAK